MEELEVNKEGAPTHINVLPAETVGQVLRELSVVDRLQCEAVNHRWKAIVCDLGWTEQKKIDREIVFEGATESQKEKFDNESLTGLFHHVRGYLIELDLESFFSFTPSVTEDILPWLKLLSNLAKLKIRRFSLSEAVDFLPGSLVEFCSTGPFYAQSLIALSENCPNLKTLQLYSSNENKVPVSVMNLFLGKYPNLKTLYLRGDFIGREPNASLISLGQLHQLEELHLEGISVFGDAALTAVATGCPQLRTLELDSIGVTEEALNELKSLPNLINFELKYHPFLEGNIQTEIIGHWKTKKCNYLRSRMHTDDDSILGELLNEVDSALEFGTDNLIRWGFLPPLVKSLSSKNTELQRQAVWALTSITVGTREHTSAVVEAGAIPEFFKLLRSEKENICVDSLWSLGIIIGVRSEYRDNCVELGIVEGIMKMMDEETSIEILQPVTCIFENICKWKDPPTSMDTVQAILPILEKCIQSSDWEIILHSIWALSHITEGGNEQIQLVLDLGVVPRIVSQLDHSNEHIQSAALSAVVNISLGTREQTQMMLDMGVLKMVPKLMYHSNDEIVKGTMRFLANITAGGEHHIQAVLDTGLLRLITKIFICVQDLQEEAIRAISNIAKFGRSEHIHYLVDFGVIPPLCNLIGDDNDFCQDILEGLMNILEKSGTRTEEICQKIKRCEGLEKIKNLRNHQSEDIGKIAAEIIDKYFSQHTEETNMNAMGYG